MNDEVLVELPANHNLKCHVCGDNNFEEREGFYFCQECGTKQDQVRLVEVEHDEEFDWDKLKTKKLKIQVPETKKPQLTSWECYNYILRGLVEELLSLGAKEELKLMALQVWSAYLRRLEVAFFNRKQADLPKLGVKYLQNDAETIYNHIKPPPTKSRRKCREDTSCTTGDESRSHASFRKSMRKLDESNYSFTSATSGPSGLTSSASARSNRAIKIEYSARSRAYLKRKMPVKHIAKHAADAENMLKCHQQPKSRELIHNDYHIMLVNIKHVYSVLAIALNLISDDIQLSDLVRFIHEGHVNTSNVLQYFPENIANNGKEMLRKINFYKHPEKYPDKVLRDHVGLLCKNIGIHRFQQPDIIKLVSRYTTELSLPIGLARYIERLINLLPPQFDTRNVSCYPGFEARAMAYIIFTLKLLYGLDGSKECRISEASQKLNSKIELLNCKNQQIKPLLFVWSEWLEYIEMRKIIISQFNVEFAKQFKQCKSTEQVLDQMADEMLKCEENDNLLNNTTEKSVSSRNIANLKLLLQRYHENQQQLYGEDTQTIPLKISFQPSLTPAHSYLKNILLLSDKQMNTVHPSSPLAKIPNFMRIDHSQRDINSYLQVKPLISYFKGNQLKLNVHVLATNKNKNYVGIFRSPRSIRKVSTLRKACFDVTEEEWSEIIKNGVPESTDDLQFIAELKITSDNCKQKRSKSKMGESVNPDMTDRDNVHMPTIMSTYANSNLDGSSKVFLTPKNDIQSVHSFEIFSENNMNPIDDAVFTSKPRRNLENIDLFAEISDEESVLNDDDDDDDDNENLSEDPELTLSNENDCISTSQEFKKFSGSTLGPDSLEEFIKVEPPSPNSKKNKENPSKGRNTLKMYTSNMDCWMIIGSIFMMTKTQKAQLQDKFPRSFNWLLETCSQTINVEWTAVFEQLLCIETMFCLGINDPKTIKSYVYMNSNNSSQKIQKISKVYREIW